MKKHQHKKQTNKKQAEERPSLKDMLDSSILEQLKQKEKELKAKEEKEKQDEIERKRKERLEKEKNKSFAELFEESHMDWKAFKDE